MSTNSIYFGTKQPSEIYYGSKKVSEVWKGSHQLYADKINITNILYWQGADSVVINDVTITSEETVTKGGEQWYSAKCGPFTDDKYQFTNKKNENLTKIDISHIDTSELTTASNMFNDCKSATDINLGNFDFSKINNIAGLFANCNVFNKLIVGPNFIAPIKIKGLNGIFSNAKKVTDKIIETLNVSNWDTSEVTSMVQCFYNDDGITKLDLSKWDFSKVTNINHFLNDLDNLNYINMNGANLSNITSCNYAFHFLGYMNDKIIGDFCNTISSENGILLIKSSLSAFENSIFSTFVGNKTLSEVINNHVCIFKGINSDINIGNHIKDIPSIAALFNGLEDNSSNDTKFTIRIDKEIYTTIPEDVVSIATNKGWTVQQNS